jgi:hypothetical protein
MNKQEVEEAIKILKENGFSGLEEITNKLVGPFTVYFEGQIEVTATDEDDAFEQAENLLAKIRRENSAFTPNYYTTDAIRAYE